MSRVRKFLVALGAALGILSSALADGVLVSTEIEAVVLALVGAVLVFVIPNAES